MRLLAHLEKTWQIFSVSNNFGCRYNARIKSTSIVALYAAAVRDITMCDNWVILSFEIPFFRWWSKLNCVSCWSDGIPKQRKQEFTRLVYCFQSFCSQVSFLLKYHFQQLYLNYKAFCQFQFIMIMFYKLVNQIRFIIDYSNYKGKDRRLNK